MITKHQSAFHTKVIFKTDKLYNIQRLVKADNDIIYIFLSLHFNGYFPDGSGLAGTRTSPFWILLELTMTEVVVTTAAIRCAELQIVTMNKSTHSFLQARCPTVQNTEEES